MKRAAVPSILVAVVLLAVAVIAEAQQPKKVPRDRISVAKGQPHPHHSRTVRRCIPARAARSRLH